jgi:hypothetical protein
MHYFSSYHLALSKLITFEPFKVTFNNHPSLFAALCDTKSDFSSGSMAEKLGRSVARNRNVSKTIRNAKHTKPMRRRYHVNFYKHINKLIIIDWLGYQLDISEVIQLTRNSKGKKQQKVIHQYLVRAGVLRDLDSILLTVRTDRQVP